MKRRSFFGWASALAATVFSTSASAEAPRGKSEFSDLREMLDAISDHTRSTGDVVLPYEAPEEQKLGFAAVDRDGRTTTFSIRLDDLRDSLGRWMEQDPPFANLLQTMFHTRAGRIKLAISFPEQRRPGNS